jgi:hypothetical protein
MVSMIERVILYDTNETSKTEREKEMDSKTVVADKPHAACIPSPVQSHIKFSKLLHHKAFHITFVNIEFNHQRFLNLEIPTS